MRYVVANISIGVEVLHFLHQEAAAPLCLLWLWFSEHSYSTLSFLQTVCACSIKRDSFHVLGLPSGENRLDF